MTGAAADLSPETAGPLRIITIDGPPSSGKTTISNLVAERFGYQSITTGMLFCAAGHVINNAAIDIRDPSQVTDAVLGSRIDFALNSNELPSVSVDGKDISDHVFSPDNKRAAPIASGISQITAAFDIKLRKLGAASGMAVFDRGSRIFPDADLKIWLTANPRIRAVRRCAQLALAGTYIPIDKIMAQHNLRELQDAKSDTYYYRPDPDAKVIDTTHLTIEQTLAQIATYITHDPLSSQV